MADPNTSPRFTRKPINAAVAVTVANTNRDGVTGTYATLYTSPTAANGGTGSRIDQIGYHSIVTTTAGMIRVFVDRGGTVSLLLEMSVAAVTPSATVKAASGYVDKSDATYGKLFPLYLEPGHVLKASTHNAEESRVIAQGGEF